ncbi:hypothetical protein ACHZG5_001516 [Yersinia enterocolitica]|uniref:Uncharacterized protein n=1 Tax=Yersinia intermedia TaxID=631 RepID=A0A208ZV22_YERIN|nr:hypothetical protein [Yersinia intermedia]EKN3392566.1 hypothetical protein [Yersinia enterocolitica]OVZ84357.1 hypothetical protein CBW57_17580 [Yersinia intermedia]
MSNAFDLTSIKFFISNKVSPHTIQIHNIKTKKARNFLRGIDAESYKSTKNMLEKIKLNCTSTDYKNSLLYVRTHPFFENTDVGQLFNKFCPKGIPDPHEYTLSEIFNEVDNYTNELCVLTEFAYSIANHLSKNELHTALDLCEDLIKHKGVSIYLLRIISFITNRYQLFTLEDKNLLNKIDKLKQSINISNNNFLAEAVSQLSNLRTSHLTISKRINDLTATFGKVLIAKSFINPIPESYEDFLKTLNAYYSFSLFDAFIYYQNICQLNLPFITKRHINTDLNIIYKEFSSIEFKPSLIYKEVDEDTGYYYLRECFLFIEQRKALNYLVIHSNYYSSFGTSRKISPFTTPLINQYFNELRSLSQLRCEKMDHVDINWYRFDPKTCGMLENSSALIFLLTKKEGYLDNHDQLLFVKLMSYSRDIGEVCSPDYLEIIADDANDHLLKLVAQCLITIKRKNQYTEHQLRATIQELCLEKFNGNLLELLKYLHNVSPAVTEHLITISNETFLSTLFHLTDKPIDALNLRADMLHWYGDITKDERFKDRAKTLKIDIQINKEKGTIDDSRIYVDPLKYQQWFEDNMVSKLTMVLDNLMISNGSSIKLDWTSKGNSVSNGEELIEYLLACYKEFCDNKVFGIASYLGRRIRHGTFKGTAITEIQKLPSEQEYKTIFEDKDFKRKHEEWLLQYENMIEDLVKNSLQIKSKKKPMGLITTDIDTPIKTVIATQLVYDILSLYSKRIGVLMLPNLIIDYCWRLVEQDLGKTKKLLSQKKSSHGVFSYTSKSQSSYMKKTFSNFAKEVNSLTGQKFGLMASWFNKPSYASPSADIYLLFNAVISEVKERVINFEPTIDIGDKTFTINGGSYYILYDALYVLIHNAAKHGKSNGTIHFNVMPSSERNAINLSLSTELDNHQDIIEAQSQINSYLESSDKDSSFIDDAHIVEGNSGMKKLKRLEKEGSISNFNFYTNECELLLCFEFDFELDLRGMYDDIDS